MRMLPIALVCLTFACCATAAEKLLEDFDATWRAKRWTFWNGAEFPGAKGSFERSAQAAHSGKFGGKLSFDFTGGGTGGGPAHPCEKHGTAVAGCVAGRIDNSLGVVGIAPDCNVISARIGVNDTISCNNSWTGMFSWTVDALAWGATQGARISNNSNSYGSPSSAIHDMYVQTRQSGMVHFASAGNNFGAPLNYPASLKKN